MNHFASASSDLTIHIVKYIDKQFERLGILNGHIDGVVCLLELDDNRIAYGSCDSSIRIWDIERMTCV